jgi:hypothetical protein
MQMKNNSMKTQLIKHIKKLKDKRKVYQNKVKTAANTINHRLKSKRRQQHWRVSVFIKSVVCCISNQIAAWHYVYKNVIIAAVFYSALFYEVVNPGSVGELFRLLYDYLTGSYESAS